MATEPTIGSEQIKATIRTVLYVGLSPILVKYVAPETIDALSSSVATVIVATGGIAVTYLWSLLNKNRLVKLTK